MAMIDRSRFPVAPKFSTFLVFVLTTSALALAAAGTAQAQSGPNEAPNASFRVNPREPAVKQRTRFNGSVSTDADGTIVRYAWDYGDGVTKVESDPISFHRYRQPGTYTATLTVTDDRGCTFGDPYATCLNSNRARAVKTVTVVDRAVDKPVVNARARQAQTGRRIRVDVEAGAREQVRASASGFVRIKGRRAKQALVPVQAAVAAGARAPLALRLRSPSARKRVAKALKANVRVRATIFVQFVDTAGNEVRQVRTLLLI